LRYAQPSNSHGRSHESTDAKNLEFDNPQLGLVLTYYINGDLVRSVAFVMQYICTKIERSPVPVA